MPNSLRYIRVGSNLLARGFFQSRRYATCPIKLFTNGIKENSLVKQCVKANQGFLKIHEDLAISKLQHINHFVIFLNGRVHLWQNFNGSFQEVDKQISGSVGQDYILNKTLLHIVTETFLISEALNKKVIDSLQAVQNLRKIFEELTAIQTYVSALNCAQQQVIAETIEFINKLFNSTPPAITQSTNDYLESMQQYINILSKDATQAQINKLYEIMQQWVTKQGISLKSTQVLVVGPEGPRNGFVEEQFFKDCYKKVGFSCEQSNEFVHYVESTRPAMHNLNPKDLIKDYGKYLLNQDIGTSLFKNKNAMKSDILKDFASAILKDVPSLNSKKSEPIKSEPRP